jgi:hypothetical protein
MDLLGKARRLESTIAVTVATLLVDNDNNAPDVQAVYATALTAAGVPFDTWDLGTEPILPSGYLQAHANVVWFTGNSYPAPLGPYETELTAFLDGGGHLFMSGQDILDQGAGTTAFVHDYLHILWDGTEVQNDKGTEHVTSVAGNPVTDGIGTVPLDHSVLGAAFEDQLKKTITKATGLPSTTMSTGIVEGLKAMGLSVLPPEGERLWTLNAVCVPDGVDDPAVCVISTEELQSLSPSKTKRTGAIESQPHPMLRLVTGLFARSSAS